MTVQRMSFRIIGCLLLFLIPAIARAADQATCTDYAAQATSWQVQQAMTTCGYSGDAWNPTDYIGHLNWCLSASPETVAAERKSRMEAIWKCERCGTYAHNAVEAQGFNDLKEQITATYAPEGSKTAFQRPAMSCGYSGDAWSSDFNAHVRWCVGVSDEEARRATESRAAWLKICETCRGYAHQAVGAYFSIFPKCRNLWSNPAMSTGRWSTDHKGHFQWCMSLGASQRANALAGENSQRAIVVEACNTGQTRGPLTIEKPAAATARSAAKPKSDSGSVEGVAKRTSSGGGNRAKSSAAARVNPCKPGYINDPCKPKTVNRTGNSAMDRLGGGTSMPDSSGAGASSRSPRPATPTARSGGGTSPGAAINSDGFTPQQLR